MVKILLSLVFLETIFCAFVCVGNSENLHVPNLDAGHARHLHVFWTNDHRPTTAISVSNEKMIKANILVSYTIHTIFCLSRIEIYQSRMDSCEVINLFLFLGILCCCICLQRMCHFLIDYIVINTHVLPTSYQLRSCI